MTGAAQNNIYLQRINLVIDHITSNPADHLSLDALAKLAAFSPFHFHRIFKSVTGEAVNQFVGRIRVERAATILRSDPNMAVLDAALAAGYKSASGFSRAFKKQFGLSPRQWDRTRPLQNTQIGQVLDGFPHYTVDRLEELANEDGLAVRIRSLPAQRLAYIRVLHSYTNPSGVIQAYKRLLAWYQGRGGRLQGAAVYGMSQDDPDVTPLEKCRFDWCVAIPADWEAEGEISIRDFPACKVAAIHTVGDIHLLDRAWQYLWRYWLPRSRYQPADLPAMEIYHHHPAQHAAEISWEQFDMDCAVPVMRL